jgi:hypothetical protein
MRKISRVFSGVGVMVAAVAMAASPAQASSDAVVNVIPCEYCSAIGYAQFNADPTNLWPGDALRACDLESDGYGIKAWMRDSNGNILRTATTQGHEANYCTGWATGDLTEEKYVYITVCRAKGTTYDLCYSADAWA